MTPKLKEAARTINELAKREEDARLSLCKAIAGAMDLVKKESNLRWLQWADQNLRRPDGSKWAAGTLYKMAMFGRSPEKLAATRDQIMRHGRSARRALQRVKALASPQVIAPKARHESGNNIQRQVEALMFAWRNASAEARKRFLEKINIDRDAA